MQAADQTLGTPEAQAPGFLTSSVGRKVVMAVTGIILFGFVTVHMLGNTQAYLGKEPFNHYAELLQTMVHGAGIWVFRGVMIAAAGLHGWAALSLSMDNWKARPVGYRAQQMKSATWASRTMRWSGVVLAAFIVYHLLHLTVGSAHPAFIKGNAYHNFVEGFRVPLASAFYIVAQLCLGLHMWHGVWSLTQTLGWVHPRYNKLRRGLASALTLLVVGVNISFPIAVLAGVIK
ncbi:MAG: succinate dehydrogenase cytochrome b subunit [Acidobacteria bacterium]|nr:succinate dehydrogenase cytochrome b subunit [Acidobacteriota bacterium]